MTTDTDYAAVVKQSILTQDTFLQATISKHPQGESAPYIKIIIRPIVIKSEYQLQFEFHRTNKVIHKNHSLAEIDDRLDELLALAFRNIYIKTRTTDIQIQITKKGKALINEHRSLGKQELNLAHDRHKSRLIAANEHPDYLKAIGLMTPDGTIKASMQGKFKQINEFLKNIDRSGELKHLSKPIHIVDCGCGNAQLTFSTYYYLNYVLNLPTYLTGVDINAQCMSKHDGTAKQMGWDKINFEVNNIADFTPVTTPQIVLALHACDTATDDALAQAIKWQSNLIFSVPCCHNNLQTQLDRHPHPTLFEPVCQHGILKERMADILTDTFRSLLLTIVGYKVSVVEFISSEHTAKNIMIRAVKSKGSIDRASAIDRYKHLKQFWQVQPYLERLLLTDSSLDCELSDDL
jgi:SAM-dependent methyltransferase